MLEIRNVPFAAQIRKIYYYFLLILIENGLFLVSYNKNDMLIKIPHKMNVTQNTSRNPYNPHEAR